ncbi:MAG: DIP1984 family protein [Thermomicrobiales bacterium]
MKLSEALIQRADSQKRIQELRGRLNASVIVQEGEQPPEAPDALLAELDRLFNQLTTLIGQINRTNLTATLESGSTLTDALAQRDVLRLRIGVLQGAAQAASGPVNRYSRTEIRQVPTVDIAALRQQTDRLSQDCRELDTAIQAANWTTELLS